MENHIQTSAFTVVASLIKVFVIVALGFWLRRRNLLSEKTITELTRLVITIVIPCFLFVRVYRQFSIEKLTQTYQMALFCVGIMLFGAGLSAGVSILLRLSELRRRSLIALSAFNNSGYLPIPLAYALLAGSLADRAVFYIAIYILVFSPFMWSWGVWLLARKSDLRTNTLKAIFTPPVIGILIGILCALKPFSPVVARLDFLVGSAFIVGEATIPLAMIIIGAILASISISKSIEPVNLVVVILIKLLIMPALVLVFIKVCKFEQVMGLVMLIEAAMPPAANLAIIAKNYGGDFAFISTTQLVTYILTAITLPIFLGIYLP